MVTLHLGSSPPVRAVLEYENFGGFPTLIIFVVFGMESDLDLYALLSCPK